MAVNELEVLLIEDNPGDARLIKEMLKGANEYLHRVDLGGTTPERSQIRRERDLSSGLERLSETDFDVVLLDLGLPDSHGLDTLVRVVNETEFTPVVVLTGLDDRDLGITAIQSGAQDYLVKDEVTGELLIHAIQHAIERVNRERERVRHHEKLEALNRLNRISQDITHTLITESTREDLERAVCERLVESDAYRFAWIGEVNRPTNQITPRMAAGVEDGYLNDVSIPIGDNATEKGPGAKAVRSQEVQVVQDTQTNPEFEPWRDEAEKRGYRSSAAIPIVYENLLHGVLGIYAATPNAFSEAETEILSRLGDVIGHAITAIERKEALVSNTVIVLEFRAKGIAEELVERSATQDWTLEIENIIRNDETLLAYGRTDGVPRHELHDVVERVDGIDNLRILSSGAKAYEFELVASAVIPLVMAVATHGGQVRSATIDNGEFQFVVELPPGQDKRQIVELVKEHCAGAVLRAQQTVTRHDLDEPDTHSVLQDRLTEKQRAVLKTAFFAGFFDWPRRTTGEEIADRFGITPATFTQHLRTAERKFFEATFENETSDAQTTSFPATPGDESNA